MSKTYTCAQYLAVREMQIKPNVRTYLSAFLIAKIKKKQIYWHGCGY